MTRMVPDDDPDWLAFWAAYPRKEAKKDARKAWKQVHGPLPCLGQSDLVDRIMAALAWQVPMRQWDGVKREFCPLPGTWLRGERWTDEQPSPMVGVGAKGLPAWAVKQ